MRRTAAALAFVLAAPALCAAQAGSGAPARRLTLLDVPYVSQSELLCGGAAAAMLVRATGTRGIYSTDFASLVDPSAGGIRTSDLEAALRARGYRVRATAGSAALARERLAAGQPVLALVEDRPGRYHYVVLVGWADGAVVYHDPARAPFVGRSEFEFDRAWSRADRWMLVLDAPGPPPSTPENARPAEQMSPATTAFVAAHYAEAARLAREAVAASAADADAWRVLGASLYLLGDTHSALDAWNRAGGPTVDLVRLDGLGRTPHRTVEQLIGIDPGAPLTRGALVRAERRLSLLPARQASRVTYVALPGNLAEVRGAVLERERVPSRLNLAIEAARLPIDRELGLTVTNVASGGDRLRVAWRFHEARPRVGVDFAFPSTAMPGIWSVSAAWQEEHYTPVAGGGPALEERRDARIGWTNWVSARLRLETGAGLARARGRGTRPLVDTRLEFRPFGRNLAIDGGASGAPGAGGFGVLDARLRWQHRADPLRFSGSAAAAGVSAGSPFDRWQGAGTGHARPWLLRAHPLIDGNAIGGPVFGRHILQGTFEAQRDLVTRGLLTAGIASFVDAARAWNRRDGSNSPLHVDVGVGLRVRFAPGYPTVRVDIARGLRDGKMALSAGFVTGL